MLLRTLLAACALFGGAGAHAATVAIRNVSVIDGTGAPAVPRQTIVFRGERIVAMGPVASVRIPKGARIVNGTGKFAIPGLWDMHVHLWDKENPLPRYIAHGVTGIRDMGSDYTRTRAWRAAAESGKAIGPHVVTCGPSLDGRRPENANLPVEVIRDPEQARRVFDYLDNQHVDFIKILSDMPRDAYFAVAERARHWELPFAGHVPRDVLAEEAIEARQASIEHLFGFPIKDEKRSRAALERCARFGTRLVPSLTLWRRMAAEDSNVKESLPALNEVVLRARQTGVAMMAGTDTGDPGTTPGVTLHEELELMVAAGLTPAEALRTATVEPAKFLGWDEAVGVLRRGMVADIVILDANPLDNIRNLRKVAGVAIRGRYLAKPELARLGGR